MNTKVILNQDLAVLGEEGDIKHVARGYARNFLFPRGIALPYNERTKKLFEARKDEIEARKMEKRKDAAGLKEKLEALEIIISMPAGANGKLYGAVTSQTLSAELAARGVNIERKKIEIPGNTIKNAGKHKVTIKLYDNTNAEVTITVEAQKAKSAADENAEHKKRSEQPAAAEPALAAETIETKASVPTAEQEASTQSAQTTVSDAAPTEAGEIDGGEA